MTITDQIKILDRKIIKNEAQHNLDRKAAKISTLSSNNLDKYECLTGEDFSLKPSSIEQTKFEYSPLGKIFNEGLSEDDKKGFFKRLKNIEKAKKTQQNIGSIPLIVSNYLKSLSQEAKYLMDELEDANSDIDYNKLFLLVVTRKKL